ncbi:uncharacterized protein B0H18DRAFT_976010 [Fomitopsis serialis]|uniref:uncharacterized protein n=1 Tax=Fomitopsis serialis TaxID=139415 RepID=UPI002007CE24|nr:uncharacterized protein B0H18DRAFT_976010 [Neoantrodia serialis]KAH9935505.1 hypothetical protein B0H18DRAFT_976010 [Neoantrodia serialis]
MAQAATSALDTDFTPRRPARTGSLPIPLLEMGASPSLSDRRSQAPLSLPLPHQDQTNVLEGAPFLLTGASSATMQESSATTTFSSKRKSPSKQRLRLVRKWPQTFIQKHWIIASTFFVVLLVSISIAVGWSLRLGSFEAAQVLDEYIPQETSLWVEMDANLISVDSDGQSITLDWFLGYFCPRGASPSTPACPDVEIYFDQNLLRGDSTASNNEKPAPIFTINATDYVAYDKFNSTRPDYRRNSPQFRTQVAMTNFYSDGRSSQSYPFDKYTSTLVFFAQSVSDNGTVPIGFGLTKGIAVGFNAKLDTNTSGEAAYHVAVKNLVVTRGQVIRIYALIIVIAIWMITITFVLACIVAVFFGKGIRVEVLVLPVTTLFAFTQLRGTMPGAPPGFGADIDFVGILPCLALLTFSSIFTCAIFLFRNPEDSTPRWQDLVHPEKVKGWDTVTTKGQGPELQDMQV